MSEFLSFRCSGCDARIKAPVQLINQRRPCPRCRHPLTVEPQVPNEQGPILVGDDDPSRSR